MNVPCSTCGGSGQWLRPLPPGYWNIVRHPELCPTCMGSGAMSVPQSPPPEYVQPPLPTRTRIVAASGAHKQTFVIHTSTRQG